MFKKNGRILRNGDVLIDNIPLEEWGEYRIVAILQPDPVHNPSYVSVWLEGDAPARPTQPQTLYRVKAIDPYGFVAIDTKKMTYESAKICRARIQRLLPLGRYSVVLNPV